MFLANVRNSGGERRGRGQLVATVLYLAMVPHTSDQLKDRLDFADPSLGRFEIAHLEVVGVQEASGSSFSQTAAQFARRNSASLDQHGLLSCLYAAAVLDGPKDARAAFESAFHDAPWWAGGGVPDHDGTIISPRIVRDPRALLRHGPTDDMCHLEMVVPGWDRQWTELDGRLQAAENAS